LPKPAPYTNPGTLPSMGVCLIQNGNTMIGWLAPYFIDKHSVINTALLNNHFILAVI
jgi:hypothetical protein